jgi:DNA-binding GntR family transcriptional regulator
MLIEGTPLSGISASPRPRTAAQERFDRLFGEIRMRICTMDYPPGFLLREEVLAKEFDVSRSPIRRVLARLEFDGLVEIRHGVGSVVTTIDPDRLREVYAMRMELTALIGRMDPRPATAGTIAEMRRCQAAFRAMKGERDTAAFARSNIVYYEMLTELVGNSLLRDLLRKLFFLTSRMWLLRLPAMDWEQTMEDIAVEIEELIRAMETDDRHGLGLVARNHIFRSMTYLSQSRES